MRFYEAPNRTPGSWGDRGDAAPSGYIETRKYNGKCKPDPPSHAVPLHVDISPAKYPFRKNVSKHRNPPVAQRLVQNTTIWQIIRGFAIGLPIPIVANNSVGAESFPIYPT